MKQNSSPNLKNDKQEVVVEDNKQIRKECSDELKLSDFITFNKLGQGAQGCVKKAIHKPTKKLIALKEISLSHDKQVRKSILAELRSLHKCEHPNILKSYGAFITE